MNPEFIIRYIKSKQGKSRFLTYNIFRFFSCVQKEHPAFINELEEKLNLSCNRDFSTLQKYFAGDYYFSPSIEEDSFDAILLYDAIYLTTQTTRDDTQALLDEFIALYAPTASSISYLEVDFDLALLLTCSLDYYAALTYVTIHYGDSLNELLAGFAVSYQDAFHFTNDNFVLFDFMDEYFEQPNCIYQPAFLELVDTLVAATLNNQNTDFETILATDLMLCQNASSSRFAGIYPFGTIRLSSSQTSDEECHILAQLFRYAVIYELRSNLYDYHLEDDRLITLENWKENLRWHYVQYSNVYEMAISLFYATTLSVKLLKKQFAENLKALDH